MSDLALGLTVIALTLASHIVCFLIGSWIALRGMSKTYERMLEKGIQQALKNLEK